jgi:hypothetical protein
MPTSLNAITQNDKIIASAVENNFNFLLTNFQSSTSPSNPSNGQLWYDSTNDLLKVYVTSSTSWVTIGPAGSSTTVTVSDTPPGSPSAGDLWFDTGTSLRLYVFTTASGGAWLDANPASSGGSSSGGVPNQQIFQSSGTFTVPPGVTQVYAYVFGGGGGSTNGNTGLIGGDGGVGVALITGLTPGANVAVTVGTGGRGSDISSNNATAGNTSSFGSFASATGGGVGNVNTSAPAIAGTFTTTGTIISRNSRDTAGGASMGENFGGGGGFTGGGAGGSPASFNGGTSYGFGNTGNSNSTWSGGAGGSPNGGVGGSGNPTFGAGGGGGGGGAVIVRW